MQQCVKIRILGFFVAVCYGYDVLLLLNIIRLMKHSASRMDITTHFDSFIY